VSDVRSIFGDAQPKTQHQAWQQRNGREHATGDKRVSYRGLASGYRLAARMTETRIARPLVQGHAAHCRRGRKSAEQLFPRTRRRRTGVPAGIAAPHARWSGYGIETRPQAEFVTGHLPGAINLPMSELSNHLRELPRDREIAAYYHGQYCVLSYEEVAKLRKRGFKAFRLEEGYPERKAAGLPWKI
jgi:rhodanese-related sulfurtransferase